MRLVPGLRRVPTWVAVLGGAGVAVVALGLLSFQSHARVRPVDGAAAAFRFTVDDAVIPEDHVLLEELEKATELRRREDFDKVLDAHDPGELIEHATLNEQMYEGATIPIDALFIVGDEFFGYLFRPENGWGRGTRLERQSPTYTPRLQRVHQGAVGGPDAFGCFSCHSKGGPDGAGMQTQNGFLFGDGEHIARADQRNAPHLLGMGPVELLGREMTAALHAEAAAVAARARAEGRRVEEPLIAKGVDYGRIAAAPDGTLDRTGIRGVDDDLVVRPFGWKGHQATLRAMVEESLRIHQGVLSTGIQKAVRDKTLDGTIYGAGERWSDLDDDGVQFEVDSGMVATVVGYLAQLEAPTMRPPHDPGLLDAFAVGRDRFEAIGCAGCHVPILELEDPHLDVRRELTVETGGPPLVLDVAKDGDGPKIEPKYAGPVTSYLVRLFSDLKRHDMGDELASPAAQGTIPARVFLTRPLWGLAETAPYLHDGRAPTVDDAIRLHGGEAAAARDAYLKLEPSERAGVRVFLTSLARAPKIFMP